MSEEKTFAQVLPWRNKEEWLEVYSKLYSTNQSDLDWALRRVAIWQARCPNSALIGVETTAGLVRALILDKYQNANELSHVSQTEVSTVYSMAIVRFVNLVCETGQNRSHVTPIRSIAQYKGIPEWLVNIRHSATHMNNIPSIDLLRAGASLALEWLKLNYWEKEIPNLNDFVPTQSYEKKNSTEEEIRQVLRDFQQIQFNILYVKTSKSSLKSNRHVLQTILGKLRMFLRKHPNTFVQILSESGFLISKYNHLESLLKPMEQDFLHNSILLPPSLEKFWSPVLSLFLHNDPLQNLLKCLLQPHFPEDPLADRVGAAWATHILDNITSEHYRLFFFSPSLNWMELFEAALKQPTEYSLQVLSLISDNVPLSDEIKQALLALVAISLGNVKSAVIPKKMCAVYTVNEVKKYFSLGESHVSHGSGSWKKYSGKAQWQTLPIGCVIHTLNKLEHLPDLEDSDVITKGVEEMPIEQMEDSESNDDPKLESISIPNSVDVSSAILLM